VARDTAVAAREDVDRVRAEAVAAREEVAGLRRDLDAGAERVVAEASRVAETAHEAAARVADVDSRVQTLGTDFAIGREQVDALASRVERLGSDAATTQQAARDAAAVNAEEMTAVRWVAENSRDGVQTLRAQLESLRAESRSARADAAAAREAARAGERRVEQMQAELTSALATLEELKTGLSHAGEAAVTARREAEQAKRDAAQPVGDDSIGVHDVLQQLIAAARGGGHAGAARARRTVDAPGRPVPVERAPRRGFDDTPKPQAILGIEGRFRELNPSFARLVGYKEHEFSKAAWPSPHDRAVYQEQQDQLRRLVSGEIDSLSVQSTYMHGQGLMVPVVGTMKVVRNDGGEPLHLLLEAEERHTG
jgi:PAS domain S-box-containing protein